MKVEPYNNMNMKLDSISANNEIIKSDIIFENEVRDKGSSSPPSLSSSSSSYEYGGDDDNLIYKSGIPTLRSSAHRVKFSMKSRKQDPKPKDRDGNKTKTTCPPGNLLRKDIFSYDVTKYQLGEEIVKLLLRCGPDIFGSFPCRIQIRKKENRPILLNIDLKIFVFPFHRHGVRPMEDVALRRACRA